MKLLLGLILDVPITLKVPHSRSVRYVENVSLSDRLIIYHEVVFPFIWFSVLTPDGVSRRPDWLIRGNDFFKNPVLSSQVWDL